ncbi:MAG TPA: protein phosphatase CheZ [Steroidobacteraceae bacterium]|nr:protein phosphatase CheZ [Steroidobacteraceae bacterium]
MSDSTSIRAQYGARVEALADALKRGDDDAFLAALDDIVHARRAAQFSELRDLTANLHVALDRFRLDSRLADFAEKDMPDARQRLAYVLKMTDEAAHRTLDLVERSSPPAERTAKNSAALLTSWKRFRARNIELREFHTMLKRMDAFLPAARADSELIRRNLGEVLLTQGYQDLTGQIIRGVIELVRELENALVELGRLSGADAEAAQRAQPATQAHGPAIPGVTQGEVASRQQDVDALLLGLGM